MSTKTKSQETIALLKRRKSKGITAKELDYMASWQPNHGATSGLLSRLHQIGEVVRLAETREGFKVYVLPDFQKDRPVEKQGRRKGECSNPECVATEQIMVAALEENKHLKSVLQSRGITYA